MATSFSVIYELFLSMITDDEILEFQEMDREMMLFKYLQSAQARFKNLTRVDLKRNDDMAEYVDDLDEELIEILATGMVYTYTNPKVNNLENAKNRLSTKDFSIHSPAALLSALESRRNNAEKDFRQMCRSFSYRR